jgi:opacity protein-like surface antigen
MRSLCLLTLCAALAAAPATAQRMGSANRNAPTAGCFIEFRGGNRIEVSYQAITLGQGRFMKHLEDLRNSDDKSTVEGYVERFNVTAKDKPLGKLNISGKITLGGKEVEAGEYGLAFMLDEKVNWKVVILDAEQKTKASWNLETKAPKATARRLGMRLVAGEQGGAELGIAFGDVSTKLAVVTAANRSGAREASGRRRR